MSTMTVDPSVTITNGYRPGAIGRLAELHGTYYAAHWNFGSFFEAKVATELSAFITAYDERRDGLWLADRGGRIEGGIAIDGSSANDHGAHLRWFIVDEALHGRGVGGQLITRAIAFCRARAYPSISLWTFEGLEAARHLYSRCGFVLKRQQRGAQWGTVVNEQLWICRLSPSEDPIR